MSELLTIGELADRSGLATSALRYYERRGLIQATRTGGNQRRYHRSQLRRVSFIRIATQVGVSLDEIGAALADLPAARNPTKADWQRLSQRWHGRLTERILLLERLRDNLAGCIGCGCLSLRSCRLNNPDDLLGVDGPGPRRLLASR